MRSNGSKEKEQVPPSDGGNSFVNNTKNASSKSSRESMVTNSSAADHILQVKRKMLQAKLRRAHRLLSEYRARSDENVQEYLKVFTSFHNPKEHQEEMRHFDLNNMQLSENMRKLLRKIAEYEQRLHQLGTARTENAIEAVEPAVIQQQETPVTAPTTLPKLPSTESSFTSQLSTLTPPAVAEDNSSEAETKSSSLNEHDKVVNDIFDTLLTVERNQDQYSSVVCELRTIVSKLTEDVHDLIDLYQIEMSHLRSELRRMEDKLSYTTHEQQGWLEDKFSSLFDKLALIETYSSKASSKSNSLLGYVSSFTNFRKSDQTSPEFEEDIGIFYNCLIAPVLNLLFSILAIVIGLISTTAHTVDILLASRYFRPFILPLTIVLITLLYYLYYCKT